ncbi:hypothetical protein [Frankia sp. R43]|uniref:hypothetical protein n=1 Tax=Frankia sp. R43 TaxID=269536 RepID=UPI000AB93792|nr:hypothetical protein [Frankia sp. R43]
MSDGGVAVLGLEDDERILLNLLPPDGATIGNRALQVKLGWDTDRYYRVRDALVDAGHAVRGRGRGGSVRRFVEPVTAPEPVNAPVAAPVPNVEAELRTELSLYEPMRRVIAGDWAKDHRSDLLAVEITAMQGRRATGGTWSRPDIVSVEVRTFSYVPGKYLEVVTFEVKPVTAINVQAVYEALAHRRAATHSYVLLHVPPAEAVGLEENIAAITDVARSHGVGVVLIGDPDDYQTWEEREEAQRVEPDPERLDAFLATQLGDHTRGRLARALR